MNVDRTRFLLAGFLLGLFLWSTGVSVAAQDSSTLVDYASLRLDERQIQEEFQTASSHPDVKRLLETARNNWRAIMAARPDEASRGPSAEELAAIDFYKGNEGYSDMNGILRGFEPEMFSPEVLHALIRLVSSGLNKFPREHHHQGTVYRGAQLPSSVLDAYAVGAVVQEKAFTSTSVCYYGAESFAFGAREPNKMVIFTIESKTGPLIALYLQDEDDDDVSGMEIFEAEVLFVPGTRFRVTDRYEDDDGYVRIEMVQE